MELKTWVKSDGTELQLNDRAETVEKAIGLGWKLAETKKRARRVKVDETKQAE